VLARRARRGSLDLTGLIQNDLRVIQHFIEAYGAHKALGRSSDI
jgi:hypothetical protein